MTHAGEVAQVTAQWQAEGPLSASNFIFFPKITCQKRQQARGVRASHRSKLEVVAVAKEAASLPPLRSAGGSFPRSGRAGRAASGAREGRRGAGQGDSASWRAAGVGGEREA